MLIIRVDSYTTYIHILCPFGYAHTAFLATLLNVIVIVSHLCLVFKNRLPVGVCAWEHSLYVKCVFSVFNLEYILLLKNVKHMDE